MDSIEYVNDNTPIRELHPLIAYRTADVLRRGGYRTVGDIRNLTEDDVMKCRCAGRKTVEDAMRFITKYNERYGESESKSENLISAEKLIDAEKLIRRIIAFTDRLSAEYLRIDNIVMMINQADTVDAVPVVRCQECARSGDAKVNGKGILMCPASGMEIIYNNFCCYGKSRESD